jgi:hypothetical protein
MQKNLESRRNPTLFSLSLHPGVLSLSVGSVKSYGVLLYSGFVEPLLQVRLMNRCVSDPVA